MNIRVVQNIDAKAIFREYGLELGGRVQQQFVLMCAKAMDPYVPMQTGTLKNSRVIVPDGVIYPGPYAHYQYMGEIWGPNVPIMQNGMIVGFFSKALKHPTGRPLTYHGAPMRGALWDVRMWADHKDDILRALQNQIGGAT